MCRNPKNIKFYLKNQQNKFSGMENYVKGIILSEFSKHSIVAEKNTVQVRFGT